MMPLTPADIHNMAFKKPPLGKRGYDEEEVDAFLDEVEQQLTRLVEENAALRGQMQGPDMDGNAATAAAAMNAEFSAIAAQLERARQERARADQNARSLQIELEQGRNAARAGRGSGGGDDRGVAVLMMAQRTADDHMRDARRESEALLADARDKSQQITVEAQVKAETIEGDARRNHAEFVTSLEAKRAALLEEIDRLGRLAQSYQAALAGHLTQQVQELDGVAQTPDATAGRGSPSA
jgi:DivIVA domain-containing protein